VASQLKSKLLLILSLLLLLLILSLLLRLLLLRLLLTLLLLLLLLRLLQILLLLLQLSNHTTREKIKSSDGSELFFYALKCLLQSYFVYFAGIFPKAQFPIAFNFGKKALSIFLLKSLETPN
jgi:hypothetical protein